MGTFDLEKKVTYNELAPSLQAMLNSNEFGIAFIRMLKTAKQGQDLKIDALNRTFIGDDNFHRCRLCETDEEFNQMKAYGPTPQDMYNSWRYYINNVIETSSRPAYDSTNRTVTLDSDVNKLSYISNNEYPYVELWAKVTCTDNSHNKEAAILASEITYDNKKFDLCVVRTHNKLALVFNYLHHTVQDPMCEIVSIDTTDIPWRAGKYCHITFKKEYNRITFSCNDIGDTSLDQKYKVQYDYPNEYNKGNVNYNRRVYKTILRYLLRNDSSTGFASNNFYGTFSILDQREMYDDDKIYHLRNYEVLMWDGPNLVARPDGFNCLMSRSFIFNPVNEHLYWFKYISHTYDMTPTGAGFSEGIDSKSMAGQVIKVHEGGNPPTSDPSASAMFTDDNFYNLKVTDNDLELQEMMLNKGISMQEIFNEWERFSMYCDVTSTQTELWWYNNGSDYGMCGFGGSTYGYNRSNERPYIMAWTYSASDNTIYNNGNVYPITGFRSNKSYTEYWIEYTIKCNDGLYAGTDYIGGIVSWMFDSAGNPHWLVVLRGNEGYPRSSSGMGGNNKRAAQNQIGFGLVYDMYRPTQKILVDITDDIDGYPSPSKHFCIWQGAGQKCTFFVGKTTTRISAKTTNYVAIGNDPGEDWDYQFDWELPKTKPADWSDEMWNNINQMMDGGPIGLMAQSYSTNFGIRKQYEVFDDADIYALHLNKVYEQTNNNVAAPTEVYMYKPGEIYTTSNTQVRILKDGSTEIYNGSGTKLIFQVIPYKKNIGSGRKSVQTYLKLTVNGEDISGSEGLEGEVTYHIQFNVSGSWQYPGASGSTTMPEWKAKGKCEDLAPKRTWLYNSTFKKLYFYDGTNNAYTKINAE